MRVIFANGYQSKHSESKINTKSTHPVLRSCVQFFWMLYMNGVQHTYKCTQTFCISCSLTSQCKGVKKKQVSVGEKAAFEWKAGVKQAR